MIRRDAAAPGSPSLPGEVARLAAELVRAIRAWEREPAPWPGERFGELALRAFRLQHRHVAPYRRWCEARGIGPDDVEDWRRVPPVPTSAFRSARLSAAPEASPLRFRTSGTTRGEARRGVHPVAMPALYRASLEAAFRRFVLDASGYPERVRPDRSALEPPVPVLSLVPAHPDSDGSSLAWMCDAVRERFGEPSSAVAAGPEELDFRGATAWVREMAAGGEPVVVLATTLALDAWTRRLAATATEIRLPPGSRIMDTGGAKGRAGLDREEVLERTGATLGVPPRLVVNELGMTELLSQRYESAADGRLHGPPWLRTRALDPVTLEPAPDGEEGVLCHFDLANAASVSAVLTEDRGSVAGGAVRHGGRTRGAPPRGCSLATAGLLAVAGSSAGGEGGSGAEDEGGTHDG